MFDITTDGEAVSVAQRAHTTILTLFHNFINLAYKFLNSGRKRKTVSMAVGGLESQGSALETGPSWGSTGTPVRGSWTLA